MRSLISLIAAISIVCGAYVYAFGVPAAVQAYISPPEDDARDTTPQASGAAAPSGRPTGGGRGGRGGSRETIVATSLIQAEPYEDILNAIGSAVAIQSAEVTSDVAGRVVETNLGSNNEVTAGDVLVRLDSREQEIDLTIANAELEQAVDTLSRYERLQSGGSSTITTVALSDARTDLSLARARAELAKSAVDDRIIRAPISGKLGLSDVSVGDTVSNGTQIVSIDNTSSLLIEFELPERAIAILGGDTTILASTPSFVGRVFDGKITAFDSRVDSVTRSVTVRAEIANDDGLLWSGMSFAVTLTSQGDEGLVVPSTAIVWARSGSSIWVVEGTSAASVPVTIIHRDEDQAWIEGDLAAGAQVVVEGTQKLRSGATVRAIPTDDTPPTEVAENVAPSDAVPARQGGERSGERPRGGGAGQRPEGGERPNRGQRPTSEGASE